jgi:signal transduction histidine kinase
VNLLAASESANGLPAHRELAAAFEALPIAVGVFDESDVFSSLNAAARALLGVAHTGPVRRTDFPLRTLAGRPLTEQERISEVVLRTGTAQLRRLLYTRPDGDEMVLDVHAAPLEGGGGCVVIVHDVTDEHGERVLAQQFHEQLFETLPIAVSVVDPATMTIVSVNRAYCDLVGLTKDEMIGATSPFPWCATEWSPPGDFDPRVERLFRHSDGRLVPVEILPFAVNGADGAPAHVVSLITSLSERRQFERQLAQSGKLAAVGELAAGVAHEINNPLFAILGLVEFLLRDAEPGTKAHERLSLIQNTGHEIKEIVRALLDFAREPTDERVQLFLRDVVHDSVELLRRISAAKGVELVERYATDLQAVQGSPNQLKQIVLNLVANAQHAMNGSGTITLAVDSEPGAVTLSVTDSGPGIQPEVLQRIFEPFFTTRRDSGGTGLGLAVSHGIAEMHGGSLTAESVPGEYTTFRLRLPAQGGQ